MEKKASPEKAALNNATQNLMAEFVKTWKLSPVIFGDL